MKKNQVLPQLNFFRKYPADLVDCPPLASSLQHLETSFLMIALGRYPDALVTCGSAIESAIKAALKVKPDDRIDFRELIEQAQHKYPSFTAISNKKIRDFRLKRNEIIHYGFSPKDNEISAILLLETGYRLIEQCYEIFFKFPLEDKNGVDGGLLPDFVKHLDVAKKVYIKARHEKNLNLAYCFISFRKIIALAIQPWIMSDWQNELLDSEELSGNEAWEIKEKQKEDIAQDVFGGVCWNFECPVCHTSDSFVVEIDGNQLDNSEVRLIRGLCVDCSLVIPLGCPFIVDILCEDQIDEEKPKILKEFLIVR